MSEPTRTAPRELWLIAQTFLNTLFALFGAPEAIAFQHTHTSQQRALLLPWLRAGEALMRRLLLIEASAYPKPNTRPLLGRTRAKRALKLVGFDDDNPETWRVSFRCLSAADRRLQPAHRRLNRRRPAQMETLQAGKMPAVRSSIQRGPWRNATKPSSASSIIPHPSRAVSQHACTPRHIASPN
jgi:hypothetical protein